MVDLFKLALFTLTSAKKYTLGDEKFKQANNFIKFILYKDTQAKRSMMEEPKVERKSSLGKNILTFSNINPTEKTYECRDVCVYFN